MSATTPTQNTWRFGFSAPVNTSKNSVKVAGVTVVAALCALCLSMHMCMATIMVRGRNGYSTE